MRFLASHIFVRGFFICTKPGFTQWATPGMPALKVEK